MAILWTRNKEKQLIELVAAGKSKREIATIMGFSISSINSKLRYVNAGPVKEEEKVVKIREAALLSAPEDQEKVIAMYQDGFSTGAISRYYRVSPPIVKRIVDANNLPKQPYFSKPIGYQLKELEEKYPKNI